MSDGLLKYDLAAISKQLQERQILEQLYYRIWCEYSVHINIGAEVEFYLPPDCLAETIEAQIKLRLEKENGPHQYEFSVAPTIIPNKLISQVQHYIKLITIATAGRSLFTAKPYSNHPGNGLHFHLNLLNARSKTALSKRPIDLEYLASWICYFMLPTLLVFAPTSGDYARFTSHEYEYMTPTRVCFGGNNRTVAVRIPDAIPKRLEHRVGSPLIDLYLALFVLVKSVYIGLQHAAAAPGYNKIYGNAYDHQYNLVPFPKNIEQAQIVFASNFFVI